MQEKVLINKIKQLLALREKKDCIMDNLKKTSESIDKIEQEVFEIMLNLNIQAIEHDKKLIYRMIKTFPKIVNEQIFFDWLRLNGYGELIKETINPNTLRAWYKEYIESHENADFTGMHPIWIRRSYI